MAKYTISDRAWRRQHRSAIFTFGKTVRHTEYTDGQQRSELELEYHLKAEKQRNIKTS